MATTNPIPIPIRPWSRLASLRSLPAPDSLPKPQSAELSVETSHDRKESATKSVPETPDVHSPMQSRKLKLSTPLKSQAQLEIKIALEEEVTTGNGRGSLKSDWDENEVIAKEVKTKGKGSSDGHAIRVITISGENKGASMQITTPHKKPFHKLRAVYANSNVQCVNNSIVLNTRLTHHDPGMHLTIPKKPFGEGFHLKKR